MTKDTWALFWALLSTFAAGFILLAGLMLGIYDRLHGEIQELDHRLSARIQELDDRLSARIQELDDRLSARIQALDDKLDTNLREIHGRLIRLETLSGFPGEELAQVAESDADPLDPLPE